MDTSDVPLIVGFWHAWGVSVVPEPQADVQAELMAETFGIYADNILTKDYFEAVLKARLDARFAQQDARLDKRFAEQEAKFLGCFAERNSKFESHFGKLERASFLHTWMLGILVIVLVVPQLQAWLA